MRGPLSQATDSPGPGAYQHRVRLGEAPKYAMRPKTAVILRQNVPGPGQYNPSKVTMRPPSAVMGKGSRGVDLAAAKGIPGPGAYMKSGEPKGSPAFSFGTARAIHHDNDVPGPGTYRLPSTVADLPRYAVSLRSNEFEYV